mmetsp:Transcript_14760/g.21820  ORF Transcript_14760/g.21820 Transcript_14760/m.21820 type:complete len:210 (-) Transcript_14760:563-1192(-)
MRARLCRKSMAGSLTGGRSGSMKPCPKNPGKVVEAEAVALVDTAEAVTAEAVTAEVAGIMVAAVGEDMEEEVVAVDTEADTMTEAEEGEDTATEEATVKEEAVDTAEEEADTAEEAAAVDIVTEVEEGDTAAVVAVVEDMVIVTEAAATEIRFSHLVSLFLTQVASQDEQKSAMEDSEEAFVVVPVRMIPNSMKSICRFHQDHPRRFYP